MTDKPKTIQEAYAEVRNRSLNERDFTRDYQSNSRTVQQKPGGTVNWGDPDNKADFFRADAALRARQQQQAQQPVARPTAPVARPPATGARPAAPVARPAVPLPPRRPDELRRPPADGTIAGSDYGTSRAPRGPKVVTGPGQGGIDVARGDVAAVVPPPNATRDQSAAAERIDRTTQDRLSGNRTLAQQAGQGDAPVTPRNLATGVGGTPADRARPVRPREEIGGFHPDDLASLRQQNAEKNAAAQPPAAGPPVSGPPAATGGPQSRPSTISGALRNIDINYESGGKKKKMSESTLINAFLRLQETKAGNIFEAAKKAKKDYDKDGKIESEKDEVWGSRIRAAKAAGKMEESSCGCNGNCQCNVKEDVQQDAKKPLGDSSAIDRIKDKLGIAPKSSVDPNYKPATGASEEDKAALKKKIDDSMKEEVDFSEAELAHFASVLEAMPVSQGKNIQTQRTQQTRGDPVGDTVPARDLTDEYIYETKKKDPSELQKRGRKAGVKVGSYKMKGMDDVAGDEAKAEPKNLVAQNPRTYNKGGKNVVDLEHPSQKGVMRTVPAKEYDSFRTGYLNTEKPADKQRMHDSMVDRVFGKS